MGKIKIESLCMFVFCYLLIGLDSAISELGFGFFFFFLLLLLKCRLCVIGLAPTHVALMEKGGVTAVDFNVGKSDRSEYKVTGKRKRVKDQSK